MADNRTPPQLPEEVLARLKAEKEAREAVLPRFQALETTHEGYTMPYRLYVPEGMDPGKKYPIVLFLHGLGECGTDNVSHVVNNEGAVIWVCDHLNGGEPRFVLAPQLPDPNEAEPVPGQPNVRWTLAAQKAILALLDELLARYPIDEKRQYVTGLSLGGYGAWMLQTLSQGRFAAVVSCCPACLAEGGIYKKGIDDCAMVLDDTPLWMFHAADDATVPVEISRLMKQDLEINTRVCGRDFFYTEYPAELHYNHFCWGAAYANEEMRQWMFRQKKA